MLLSVIVVALISLEFSVSSRTLKNTTVADIRRSHFEVVKDNHLHKVRATEHHVSGLHQQTKTSTQSLGSPEDFIAAFKRGWVSAVDPNWKSRSDVTDTIVVNEKWEKINNDVSRARQLIIKPGSPISPEQAGFSLIEEAFKSSISSKWETAGQASSGSASGSVIFISEWHETSQSQYILKSEPKSEFWTSWEAVMKGNAYADRIDDATHSSCDQTTLMKILMVFEPKDVDRKVNNKVFVLIAHVNPIPPHADNEVFMYDVKHSREISRCSVYSPDNLKKDPDPSQGFLGDFMHEFGASLREALTTQKEKARCFMNATTADLRVLDISYSDGTKLVDQSEMFFLIKKNGIETSYEKQLADSSNRVFRMSRDGEKWLVVLGIIDLFAYKTSAKRLQSHASYSTSYLFQMHKFNLYPLTMRCMMQYLFYYVQFPNPVDSYVGEYWGCSRSLSNVSLTAKEQQAHSKSVHATLEATESGGGNWASCMIVQSCHGVLQTVEQHFETCCRKGAKFTEKKDGMYLMGQETGCNL